MEDESARGYLVRLDDGHFVERDVLGIIQKIMDYDRNLKVQYLEYAANMNEAPWRIVELCKDGKWRVVMYAWEMNEAVFERIWKADTQKFNVGSEIEFNNARVRSEQQRRYRDDMDEAQDIAAHVFASPKGRYTLEDHRTGKRIKLDDDPLRKAVVEDIE